VTVTDSDLIIRALADEGALLREQLMQFEADARTYREIALAAVDALQDTTRQRDRLQRRCEELRADLRRVHEDRWEGLALSEADR
jgi:hypothetical protein